MKNLLLGILLLLTSKLWAQEYNLMIQAVEVQGSSYITDNNLKPIVKFTLTKNNQLQMQLSGFGPIIEKVTMNINLNGKELNISEENELNKVFNLGVVNLIPEGQAFFVKMNIQNWLPGIYDYMLAANLSKLLSLKSEVVTKPIAEPTKVSNSYNELSSDEINKLAIRAQDLYFKSKRNQVIDFVNYNAALKENKNPKLSLDDQDDIKLHAVQTVQNTYLELIEQAAYNSLNKKTVEIAKSAINSQIQAIKDSRVGEIRPLINDCSAVAKKESYNLASLKFGSVVHLPVYTASNFSSLEFSDSKVVYTDFAQHYSSYGISQNDWNNILKTNDGIRQFSNKFRNVFENNLKMIYVNRNLDSYKLGLKNAKVEKKNLVYLDIANQEIEVRYQQALSDLFYRKNNQWCAVYQKTYTDLKILAERAHTIIEKVQILDSADKLDVLSLNVTLSNDGLLLENQKLKLNLKDESGNLLKTIQLSNLIPRLTSITQALNFEVALSDKLSRFSENNFILELISTNTTSSIKISLNFSELELINLLQYSTNSGTIYGLRKLILNELASEWFNEAESSFFDTKFYQGNTSLMNRIYQTAKSKNKEIIKAVLQSKDSADFNSALKDIKDNSTYSYLHPWDGKKANDFLRMYQEMLQ